MEGQGGGGHAEAGGDLTRGHATRPGVEQDAQQVEPGGLPEGSEGEGGVLGFHHSSIIEL